MRNHPANRQIKAVIDAGHDPQVGTWPGDPGFEGDGSVSGHVINEDGHVVLYIRDCPATFEDALRELVNAYVKIDELRNQVKALRGH